MKHRSEFWPRVHASRRRGYGRSAAQQDVMSEISWIDACRQIEDLKAQEAFGQLTAAWAIASLSFRRAHTKPKPHGLR